METFEKILEILPEQVRELLFTNKLLRERKDYHPEESAFEHIRIVTERGISTGIPELVFTGIFHDITKYVDHTINPVSGHPTSLLHDLHGAKIAEENSEFIAANGANPEAVVWLCEQHMRVKNYDVMRKKKREELEKSPYWPLMVIFQKMDNMKQEFNNE